jgi:hypothetical protein
MRLLKERFHHKLHEEHKGHGYLLVAFSMKIRLALLPASRRLGHTNKRFARALIISLWSL